MDESQRQNELRAALDRQVARLFALAVEYREAVGDEEGISIAPTKVILTLIKEHLEEAGEKCKEVGIPFVEERIALVRLKLYDVIQWMDARDIDV